VENCLQNALRLETYVADAERDGDKELVELFRKVQSDSKKGAELGRGPLRSGSADRPSPSGRRAQTEAPVTTAFAQR